MKDWKQDKRWADTFLPHIERILRACAGEIIEIKVADPQDDQNRATDYVIELVGGRVGCRIRRCEYMGKFGDFTLRSSRPSGHKTEIEKIAQGWGDWYLYGWECGDELADWKLVDLRAFRATLIDKPCGKRANRDGSSDFHYWSFARLRLAGCLTAEAQPNSL